MTTLNNKLIYIPQLKEWEMNDLRRDPHEMHSVYGDPAHAAVQSQLRLTLTPVKS